MNSADNISGFTLIELIVVLSLISAILLFSLPVLDNNPLIEQNTQTSDINRLVNDLKKRSVIRQIDITLWIDPISGSMWVTDDTMDEEALNLSKEKATPLSDDISIVDIVYSGDSYPKTEEYQIKFRKLGYSDFARIHLIDGEKNLTLSIEPFLPRVKLLDGHVHFDECI